MTDPSAFLRRPYSARRRRSKPALGSTRRSASRSPTRLSACVPPASALRWGARRRSRKGAQAVTAALADMVRFVANVRTQRARAHSDTWVEFAGVR